MIHFFFQATLVTYVWIWYSYKALFYRLWRTGIEAALKNCAISRILDFYILEKMYRGDSLETNVFPYSSFIHTYEDQEITKIKFYTFPHFAILRRNPV